MLQTRRHLLATGAALGATTLLPYCLRAEAQMPDRFETSAGPVTVIPVSHASVVLDTPQGAIYVDPVGDPAAYDGLPAPALILVTHEHGDHFSPDTLRALSASGPQLVTNPAVAGMLPGDFAPEAIANGESAAWADAIVDAIPAYNTTEGRTQFHPRGRDNGYVLTLPGMRIYLSGDTEDIPEMRALDGIDLAFLCMNLPYTMSAEQAASAVQEFRPTYVYPYHYGGGGEGAQDPAVFADLAGDATEVRFGDWYG